MGDLFEMYVGALSEAGLEGQAECWILAIMSPLVAEARSIFKRTERGHECIAKTRKRKLSEGLSALTL